MKTIPELNNTPDRDKIIQDMTESEKKASNLLMDFMDLKAVDLGKQWGRSIRNLL